MSERTSQTLIRAAQAWGARATREDWSDPTTVREVYDRLLWAWVLAGDPLDCTPKRWQPWLEACASAVSKLVGDLVVGGDEWADLGDAQEDAQARITEAGRLSSYPEPTRCERYGLEGRGQLDLTAPSGMRSCEPWSYCAICAVREEADEAVAEVVA